MTELSGLATTHAAYAPPARGSIGVAFPGTEVRVLAGHPDVALVGVGRVPDPTLGEVAHAYIVPAQGHVPDPDAIFAFARTQLAPYKIPKAVHVVAALPSTASGKIRRRDLTPPPGMPGTPGA
jgi:acyl-coenzyme A synthetase/AMP-(fatty) acid ligase